MVDIGSLLPLVAAINAMAVRGFNRPSADPSVLDHLNPSLRSYRRYPSDRNLMMASHPQQGFDDSYVLRWRTTRGWTLEKIHGDREVTESDRLIHRRFVGSLPPGKPQSSVQRRVRPIHLG